MPDVAVTRERVHQDEWDHFFIRGHVITTVATVVLALAQVPNMLEAVQEGVTLEAAARVVGFIGTSVLAGLTAITLERRLYRMKMADVAPITVGTEVS